MAQRTGAVWLAVVAALALVDAQTAAEAHQRVLLHGVEEWRQVSEEKEPTLYA